MASLATLYCSARARPRSVCVRVCVCVCVGGGGGGRDSVAYYLYKDADANIRKTLTLYSLGRSNTGESYKTLAYQKLMLGPRLLHTIFTDIFE